MKTVSVSAFRKQLFRFLDEVGEGGIVVIERHGKPVGKLVPASATNWREAVTAEAGLLVAEDGAFSPMDDLWVEHT